MDVQEPKFRIVVIQLLNGKERVIDLTLAESHLLMKKRDGLLTESEANTVVADLKATFPLWDFTKRQVES